MEAKGLIFRRVVAESPEQKLWHIFFSLVWASPKTNQRRGHHTTISKKEVDNPSLTFSSHFFQLYDSN